MVYHEQIFTQTHKPESSLIWRFVGWCNLLQRPECSEWFDSPLQFLALVFTPHSFRPVSTARHPAILFVREQKNLNNKEVFWSLRKWFEPNSKIPRLKVIIWIIVVLRGTAVCDWRFDNLCAEAIFRVTLKTASAHFIWNVSHKQQSFSGL